MMRSARRRGDPELSSLPVELTPLETAWRWIDDNATRLAAERVDLAAAGGRVPAEPPIAASDVPQTARAVEDGYAVRAEATVGAGPYSPLFCPAVEASDGSLPPSAVARMRAGQPLPAGADAVLPDELTAPEGKGRVGILGSVAPGDGVAMAAGELRAGEPLWQAGRRRPLRAAEIGLLGAAGIPQLAVVRRPRTRILLAGVAAQALGPMLRALVQRDGGAVIGVADLEAAQLADGADVVLVAASDWRDVEVVTGGGGMAIRGVAIEPGRETCLARLGDAVLALLPALPAACFWAYELVAGRAIRCRAGRDPGLPFATRRLRTARKIASPLGLTEAVPVRLDPAEPDAFIPLPGGPSPRLRNAAAADGFVLVPATSEGVPAGSELAVWLFGPPGEGTPGGG